ncbi:MAG: ATP-binding cassette domain-containing protein [Bacilli bacterium]|nr:ATP-binding cassette domain-containing protein [Bacilli bacterium]
MYDNLVQAVFDFSLDIKKGEFVVLVGPSGCGKSTTLRMIAGLEEITAGNLFIDNKYANVLSPKDRDISMVFQSYALYPHMSVYDNMAFAMQIRPYAIPCYDGNGNPVLGVDENEIKRIEKEIKDTESQLNNVKSYGYQGATQSEVVAPLEAHLEKLNKKCEEAKTNQVHLKKVRKYSKSEINEFVDEAAKILQIQEYLDRKPRELSGGQRQRVALGRAIVKKSKLFLMDEPLSNLDAKLRVSMRSEIKRLHKSIGATTIYVTHDQTEAMTMADRIVIMNKGYIQQIGTPQEIYNHPSNVFVATFIGSPAMNILDVELSKNAVTFQGGETLTLSKGSEERVVDYIKSKIAEIEAFEKNGLAEEEAKQRQVTKETLILKMKTSKAKKAEENTRDVLDEITLNEEEKEICKSLFEKKLAVLLEKKAKYQAMLDSGVYNVKFGIRPEYVYVKGSSLESDVVPSEDKKLLINISELLGNEFYLHGNLGGKDFVLKSTSSHPVAEGEEATIVFDLARVHIFDSIDERIIF